MNKFTAGSPSIPEVEMELSDDGRETPSGSSTDTNTPDPNPVTPGSVVRGDGDDTQ
jgi:hypothetical protein